MATKGLRANSEHKLFLLLAVNAMKIFSLSWPRNCCSFQRFYSKEMNLGLVLQLSVINALKFEMCAREAPVPVLGQTATGQAVLQSHSMFMALWQENTAAALPEGTLAKEHCSGRHWDVFILQLRRQAGLAHPPPPTLTHPHPCSSHQLLFLCP